MSHKTAAAILSIFIIVSFGITIRAWHQLESPTTIKPEYNLKMERALYEVKSGDLLEINDGSLILVYGPAGGEGGFRCYRPEYDGGVELMVCLVYNYTSVIKRVIRPREPKYKKAQRRFMQQMLPKQKKGK